MAGCRIEDFALIGDCETAALMGRDGSIDWLCWPRFDSDACFAAILGTPEHGRWQIAPEHCGGPVTRRYRGDTLILETRFETPDGVVTLIDLMPPRGRYSDIVRIVRGESGAVRLRMELALRFGYGRTIPWVTRLQDGSLRVDPVISHEFNVARAREAFEVARDASRSGKVLLTFGPERPRVDQPDPPK